MARRFVISILAGVVAAAVFGSLQLQDDAFYYVQEAVAYTPIPWDYAGPVIAGLTLLILALPAVVVAVVTSAALRPRWDGETRCRNCGHILKGISEPRYSECGEPI